MGKKISVAVLGSGMWGRNHVRVWSELGALQAVCDSDAARLREIQSQFAGVDVHLRAEEVLSRADIQAVVIATPAPTHYALAMAAMRAGKDVLVEKPMALTSEEGKLLLEESVRLNRILMVGHVLEYHPAITRLRALVNEGALGRVQYIYSNRLNLGRIRTEENALWSFAPHDVAIILRLVGKMPQQISCHGAGYLNREIADVTLTHLSFATGIEAHIYVSWLHPFKEQRLVVVGDRQMAVFDDTRPWEEKLLLYPHRVDWSHGNVPVAQKSDPIAEKLESEEPLKIECLHFLNSVATRERPMSDAEEGVRVLQVLEAAQKSLEAQGTRMPLDHPRDSFYAHPTAIIDKGAVIGAGTRIWHFSHVMSQASIGSNCVLGQNVFVAKGVQIGNGVKIQNNVSVYEGVQLEDHVFCGPSMVFTNVNNPRSAVVRKHEFQSTLIRTGASLGANCTIVCGATIGKFAFVGAGAVVTHDVPDYALVVGVPAQISGWICECGVKLKVVRKKGVCEACGLSYHMSGDETLERVS
ncbi:Gfo/Idh/MocA family oxidoreductase [Candidatus Acetothermia bacterium]|nr:Gfo/Idh/MocA family oxidoreductase [Candidatus Acetothermia bacterium]MBI3643993.1 Gfo/Idh/MocA family oxidoreductase [Candidatus Acetothermia bacterium]